MLFLYGWFFGNFWGRDSFYPWNIGNYVGSARKFNSSCFPIFRPETSWCERWTEHIPLENWHFLIENWWLEDDSWSFLKCSLFRGNLLTRPASRGHRESTVWHPAMKSPKAMSYGAPMRGWNNPSYSTHLFSAIYRGYFTPCITGNLDPLCGSRCLLWCKVSFPCLRNNYCRLTRRCGGEVLHQFEKHQKLAKKMFEKGWCALIVLLLAHIG